MESLLQLWCLPLAVGLGALHALEPGHAKTMIAAYLIGTRGTKRDALVLGTSAAATHSLVVIALAVTGLWLGEALVMGAALRWLQLGSGLLVIAVGAWMLWRRLRPGARRNGQASHFGQHQQDHHHGAPDPVAVRGALASGQLAIVGTPAGERMRLILDRPIEGLDAQVATPRAGGRVERLALTLAAGTRDTYLSTQAPEEPHEYQAELALVLGERAETVAFAVHEPGAGPLGDHVAQADAHAHDDEHEDDADHAAAHAKDMPEYAQRGQRPTLGQVIAFGATAGLIPCPASVTIMLLALTVGQAALGLVAVLCFSVGLALTMVAIGMAVVYGAQAMSASSRMAWFSRRAPALSACAILLCGCASVALALHAPR